MSLDKAILHGKEKRNTGYSYRSRTRTGLCEWYRLGFFGGAMTEEQIEHKIEEEREQMDRYWQDKIEEEYEKERINGMEK